jgi:hypothetical protein
VPVADAASGEEPRKAGAIDDDDDDERRGGRNGRSKSKEKTKERERERERERNKERGPMHVLSYQSKVLAYSQRKAAGVERICCPATRLCLHLLGEKTAEKKEVPQTSFPG